MFRRGGYGSAFGRRSGRGSRGFRFSAKRGVWTVNHCEATSTTTGGVDLQTSMFTCVSGPTNRSTHIPEGSVLRKLDILAWATDATPVTGKHQMGLWYTPGAQTAPASGYVTAWFAGTDPITSDMWAARRNVLCYPQTKVVITGHDRAAFFRLRCTKNKYLRDGDDINLDQLDSNATNWSFVCIAKYIQ